MTVSTAENSPTAQLLNADGYIADPDYPAEAYF
jgi:hypothetical protein